MKPRNRKSLLNLFRLFFRFIWHNVYPCILEKKNPFLCDEKKAQSAKEPNKMKTVSVHYMRIADAFRLQHEHFYKFD